MVMSYRGELGENNWWASPHGITMEPLLDVLRVPYRVVREAGQVERAITDAFDGDELVIVSLGSSVDEWYSAAPHMRAASLFQQQLGCVTPEAFGLAAGLGEKGLRATRPFLIVAKVDPSVPQDIRRKHSDGREDKYIFVRHVEETEGIVIMGPSEHN
jgi:hypothetical protein